jgi:uncharacterized ferredoxin-like protein
MLKRNGSILAHSLTRAKKPTLAKSVATEANQALKKRMFDAIEVPLVSFQDIQAPLKKTKLNDGSAVDNYEKQWVKENSFLGKVSSTVGSVAKAALNLQPASILQQGAGKIGQMLKGLFGSKAQATLVDHDDVDVDNPQDTVLQYASMASAAYKPEAERIASMTEQLGENHGWELMNALSHDKTSVFKNDTKKEAVISFRGTAGGKGVKEFLTGDLGTDLAIVAGVEGDTGRFKKSEKEFLKVVKHFQKNNPDYKIITTGHSLGGAVARHIHKKYNDLVDETHMWNAGTSLATDTTLDDTVHSHHVATDPISFFGIQNHHNVHFYKKSEKLSHFMDNFFG